MDVQDERTMKTDFERRFDFAVRSALLRGDWDSDALGQDEPS